MIMKTREISQVAAMDLALLPFEAGLSGTREAAPTTGAVCIFNVPIGIVIGLMS